jgi:arabinose-5-phosphate isomerase
MKETKEICLYQIRELESMINSLNEENIAIIESVIAGCKGILYFTGIGKNGHVAAKTASTFASIGIKSMFINPVDAVHGDMGNITNKDIVFAISKSGNTKELISFVWNLKNNTNTKVILLHSNINNDLKELIDYEMYLDIPREADEFNIVPTVSISAYTVFLQSIGIAIANKNGFKLSIFKKNHPGGNIGDILKNE